MVELKDEERTRCEVWTRVMGYHRPVSSYNIGKQGEFQERVFFTEQNALNGLGKSTACANIRDSGSVATGE